jgi:hypothetical protein
MTWEQWNECLDEMIWALEVVSKQEHSMPGNDVDMERLERGCELFGRHLTKLWW